MVDIHQNKLSNFLIIGLGNIGKRHLESLLKTKNSKIYVKDKNINNLNDINLIYKKKNIIKIQNYTEINENIDLAIIATNSDIRPKILDEVIKFVKVKNIILEKVVFQKLNYFKKFLKISQKKKINIYVNYPRRFIKFFQIIKKEIKINQSNFEIMFQGKNWGLCCNSLHFIDLFFFLSCKKITKVQHYDFLKSKVYRSKRSGFYELKGKINYECNNSNKLTLIDSSKFEKNLLTIKFANLFYEIEQKNNRYFVTRFENILKNKFIKYSLVIPQQSNLTYKYFLQLNNKSKRNFLTNLEESYYHHNILFSSISGKFKQNYNNIFPIT